jgi:hypothetical protein
MGSEQRTISSEATTSGEPDEATAAPDGEVGGAEPAAARPAPGHAPTPGAGIPAVPASGAEGEVGGESGRSDSSPPPDSSPPDDKKGTSRDRRNRFEALLPGIIRRGLERSIEAGLNTFEKSLETGRETTGAVREVLNEVKAPRDVANAVGKALSEAKLPRELASAVLGQLDDTKNDVLRILAREFREFLDSTDVSGALKEALTSLSFEVRTEIRFIPNEAGEGVKADVRARSRIKRNAPPPPRERRRRGVKKREADEDEDDESSES